MSQMGHYGHSRTFTRCPLCLRKWRLETTLRRGIHRSSSGSLAMCAAIRRVMHESIETLIFFDACSYVGAIEFRPLLL
jgi:hypothetical protein